MGNRRMTLPRISRGKFEELVALRVAVEVHAAERALPYISDIIIEKMVTIDNEMDELILAGNLEPITLLNYEFHRVLYTANSEQAAMPIIESIWLQLGSVSTSSDQADQRILYGRPSQGNSGGTADQRCNNSWVWRSKAIFGMELFALGGNFCSNRQKGSHRQADGQPSHFPNAPAQQLRNTLVIPSLWP